MGAKFMAVTPGIWKLLTLPLRWTKKQTACFGGIGPYARFSTLPPMKVSSASRVAPPPPILPASGQPSSAMHSRTRWPKNQAIFMLQFRVRWIWRVGKPFLELQIMYVTCSQMCMGAWRDSKIVPIRTVNCFRQA
jgi:hypothetical protein